MEHWYKFRAKLCKWLPTFPYQEYNLRYRCIFVHIPKNAGTSILSALGASKGRWHRSYVDYKMSNSKRFKEFFKFSIVRNPYDRTVSIYEYLKAGGNHKPGDLMVAEEIKSLSFEEFVYSYLDEYKIHEILVARPQYLFLCDSLGDVQVDFVGRYEHLSEDVAEIFRKLQIEQHALENLNPSERRRWSEYYKSSETSKKVEMLYKKDFEIFQYEHLE